jgi:hypothetical protein
MKPVRPFPTALHVMAVAILASGFFGAMVELAAQDPFVLVDRSNESAEASASLGQVEIQLAVMSHS